MKLNLNDSVRVRLNDVGHDLLRKRHKELNALLVKSGAEPVLGDGLREEDAEGWSQWELWDLMWTFGKALQWGTPPPFETPIEVG